MHFVIHRKFCYRVFFYFQPEVNGAQCAVDPPTSPCDIKDIPDVQDHYEDIDFDEVIDPFADIE